MASLRRARDKEFVFLLVIKRRQSQQRRLNLVYIVCCWLESSYLKLYQFDCVSLWAINDKYYTIYIIHSESQRHSLRTPYYDIFFYVVFRAGYAKKNNFHSWKYIYPFFIQSRISASFVSLVASVARLHFEQQGTSNYVNYLLCN